MTRRDLAESLNFTVADVVRIVSTALMLATMWYSLRSEVRDLKTTFQYLSGDVAKVQQASDAQGKDINDIKLALAAAGLYKGSITIVQPPAPAGQTGGNQ